MIGKHEKLIPTRIIYFSNGKQKSWLQFASGVSDIRINSAQQMAHNMCIDPERIACIQSVDPQVFKYWFDRHVPREKSCL